MNKKQLEYFMETYHYRNIQAAADNLYISHQGLSRVIRSLEDELGQEMCIRDSQYSTIPRDAKRNGFLLSLEPGHCNKNKKPESVRL